ncbi:MAG: hypothetical protein V7K98_20205 [Nostoc sp.]
MGTLLDGCNGKWLGDGSHVPQEVALLIEENSYTLRFRCGLL